MLEFLFDSPVVLGWLVSVIIGLPIGINVVWEVRDHDKVVDKDTNVWDSEWDSEEEE